MLLTYRNYRKSGKRQEVIKFILTQPVVLLMHGKKMNLRALVIKI